MAAGHKASSDQHLITVHESTQNSGGTLRTSTTAVQHVLKIQGYSWMSKSFGNGIGLQSKSFRVGGSTGWHIKFYPNGHLPKNADSVSVLAFLDAAYLAVKAQIGFDVLDHTTGEPMPRYAIASSEVLDFRRVGNYRGYDDFIAREELDKLLRNDCLSVSCNITVFEFLAGATARPPRSAVPPPDWPHHFRELLRSEQGADVRFQVDGETFAVHRCVLAARSPVFKAELYGVMKESSAFVRIHGMRAEVFRNLLHFAYTDELPPETEDYGAAMAQHLLEAAYRSGLERLKLVCEDRLCKHMDVSTAVTMLVLAEQHRCHGLKEACFEFLLNSSTTLEAVMATDDFDNLCKSCPGLLKDIMSKLGAHLHGIRQREEDDNQDLILRTTEGLTSKLAASRSWQEIRHWKDDNHDLTLRTTEGDELPELTDRIFALGASKNACVYKRET